MNDIKLSYSRIDGKVQFEAFSLDNNRIPQLRKVLYSATGKTIASALKNLEKKIKVKL